MLRGVALYFLLLLYTNTMQSLRSILTRLKDDSCKKWLFPSAVIICLLFATGLKISGSSFGPYYDLFLQGKPSSNLIAGETRHIRSDEWLVVTQFTIAQKAAGYPLINKNFGDSGKNMSLVSDAPYKEWSTIFRPQNLAFFIIPFEFALAFKWWFLLASLLLSMYFLALKFLPGKYSLASLLSIVGSFTPFIFWWYQTITIMSIVWGIVILLTAMRLIERRPLSFLANYKRGDIISQLILSGSLIYSLVGFALLLYPAFQIPVVITVGLVFLGYYINTWRKLTKKTRKRLYINTAVLTGSALVAIGIIGVFLITRLDAVRAISGTDYPGARFVHSGTPSQADLIGLAGYSQYRLQDNSSIGSIDPSKGSINQSELSASIIIPFAFIIPILLILLYQWRKKRMIDWVGVAIVTTCLVFAAHLFLPGFSTIAKPFMLHLVPITRLQLGLGFVGILSLLYVIANGKQLVSKYRPWVYLYSGLMLIIYILTIISVVKFNRDFAGDLRILGIAAISFSGGLALVFIGKEKLGLLLLSALCIMSTITIQPLYKGLGSGYNSNIITNKIASLSSPDDAWGLSGTVVLENFPQMANRKSITGVHTYPDKDFWSKVSKDKTIYNRYAHVLLSDTITDDLKLTQPDVFIARLSCNNHLGRTITHVLATTPLQLPCYKLIDQTTVGGGTIMFYKRTP